MYIQLPRGGSGRRRNIWIGSSIEYRMTNMTSVIDKIRTRRRWHWRPWTRRYPPRGRWILESEAPNVEPRHLLRKNLTIPPYFLFYRGILVRRSHSDRSTWFSPSIIRLSIFFPLVSFLYFHTRAQHMPSVYFLQDAGSRSRCAHSPIRSFYSLLILYIVLFCLYKTRSDRGNIICFNQIDVSFNWHWDPNKMYVETFEIIQSPSRWRYSFTKRDCGEKSGWNVYCGVKFSDAYHVYKTANSTSNTKTLITKRETLWSKRMV